MHIYNEEIVSQKGSGNRQEKDGKEANRRIGFRKKRSCMFNHYEDNFKKIHVFTVQKA